MSASCPLCRTDATLYFETPKSIYCRCPSCLAVFLDPRFYLSPELEKKRYEEHRNDVEDPRYQKFVSPIVDAVKRSFSREHCGLDFGAGTGPVITKLLREDGYSVELYDPYFWNDPSRLQVKYDFIACCEVTEHFYDPAKEFVLLHSLLKTGGKLFCMTEQFHDGIDFPKWYYKNDPTHVFFYHEETFQWIRKHFAFSSVTFNGRLIELTKSADNLSK